VIVEQMWKCLRLSVLLFLSMESVLASSASGRVYLVKAKATGESTRTPEDEGNGSGTSVHQASTLSSSRRIKREKSKFELNKEKRERAELQEQQQRNIQENAERDETGWKEIVSGLSLLAAFGSSFSVFAFKMTTMSTMRLLFAWMLMVDAIGRVIHLFFFMPSDTILSELCTWALVAISVSSLVASILLFVSVGGDLQYVGIRIVVLIRMLIAPVFLAIALIRDKVNGDEKMYGQLKKELSYSLAEVLGFLPYKLVAKHYVDQDAAARSRTLNRPAPPPIILRHMLMEVVMLCIRTVTNVLSYWLLLKPKEDFFPNEA